MRPGRDLLEVSPTDAAGVDSQEELSGGDLGDWNGFYADVTHAAIHRRLHGGGNRFRLVRS